jgi:hypothetical protein
LKNEPENEEFMQNEPENEEFMQTTNQRTRSSRGQKNEGESGVFWHEKETRRTNEDPGAGFAFDVA